MSLRLILVRHAKSDWSGPERPDHDRPLNQRGRRAAPAMGRWLAERASRPELALLSTAVRARTTWDLIAPELGGDIPVAHDPTLYHAAPEAMLAALSDRPERCVLLLGHNPGIVSLAQWLVIETPDRVEFHRFPTGATLILAIERSDWADLSERCARVEAFAVPRDLPDHTKTDRG